VKLPTIPRSEVNHTSRMFYNSVFFVLKGVKDDGGK